MFKEIIELARLAANGGMYDRFFLVRVYGSWRSVCLSEISTLPQAVKDSGHFVLPCSHLSSEENKEA